MSTLSTLTTHSAFFFVSYIFFSRRSTVCECCVDTGREDEGISLNSRNDVKELCLFVIQSDKVKTFPAFPAPSDEKLTDGEMRMAETLILDEQ